MKYLMVITLSIASILSAAADNLKYAPHNFSVLPPSPEVESLNRYIDFGASLASGQPDINLPIYEVSHGSLSVPISIGYHGGGIKVNEKTQILDEEGQVIPDLYAGGSDAGGLYGDSYDVSLAPGSQASWANNSGRIIAMEAAKYLGK